MWGMGEPAQQMGRLGCGNSTHVVSLFMTREYQVEESDSHTPGISILSGLLTVVAVVAMVTAGEPPV